MANQTEHRGSHVLREETARTSRRKSTAAERRSAYREPRYTDEDFTPVKKKKKRSSKARRRRAMRRMRNTLILVISLLIALVGGALYAGSCVSASKTNLPGVYLNGIDVSGLTRDETETLLGAQGWEEEAATPLTVQLPAGVSFEVDRAEAGAVQSIHKMAELAFSYGHSGNWVNDLRSYLSSRLGSVELSTAAELNEEYIARCVQEAETAFIAKLSEEAGYTVDRENAVLLIRKGADALALEEGRLTEAVRQALLNGETSLSFGELTGQPTMPDFAAIYQELNIEPQDAYFVEGGWDVVDEVVGCTFDVNQANQLWESTGWLDEVRVPLTITYPEVTGESLRGMLFHDLLGEQTTYFPNSIDNRISNIQLAASKLNGLVLYPGDVFSYNETIGERTLEAGFLMAGAYSNGEEVEELGGGICQVSSTLYCAVLRAQLGIRSRDNHYFKVVYLDYGLDATVSWPSPDFKFCNTRDYPIRINAYADPVERYITVEIWGTDVDGTHIEFESERYRVEDPTWGVQIGWNVYLHANVYDAEGNLIEVRDLPASTYYFHSEDIDWPPEKYAADAEG